MTASFPAAAQTGVAMLVSHVDIPAGNTVALVDVRVLNESDASRTVELPARIDALLVTDSGNRPVELERAPDTPASIDVAPGRFVAIRYRLAAAAIPSGARLSVPQWGGQQIALSTEVDPPAAPTRSAEASPPTPSPADRSVGNAFLGNLSAYEPVYAVYGPGTDSEARIQLSFKYQLFGSHVREDRPASIRDGLYFAYTQRMFWDLGAESSPFRNIDYQPELFYLSQPLALSDKATLSGQIGVRHESNGRAGAASRSVNTLYVAPMMAWSLGKGRRLMIAPRAWLYVGDRSGNPDIRRYRGNTGLFAEIGDDEGLRLSTYSRLNLASGKGSFAADLSYPLRQLVTWAPDFYLFGQSFVGYGENLLDYNRRTTRFRFGVALVR